MQENRTTQTILNDAEVGSYYCKLKLQPWNYFP